MDRAGPGRTNPAASARSPLTLPLVVSETRPGSRSGGTKPSSPMLGCDGMHRTRSA